MVLLQGGAPVGQRDAFSGPSRILIRQSEMPSSAVGPYGPLLAATHTLTAC